MTDIWMWEYTNGWQIALAIGVLLVLCATAVPLSRSRRSIRLTHANPLRGLPFIAAEAAEQDIPVFLSAGRTDALIIKPQDAATLELGKKLAKRAAMAEAPVRQAIGAASLYCAIDAIAQDENEKNGRILSPTSVLASGSSPIVAGLESAQEARESGAESIIMWGDTPTESLVFINNHPQAHVRIVGAINPADWVLLSPVSDICVMGEDVLAYSANTEQDSNGESRLVWHDLVRMAITAIIIVGSIVVSFT